VLTALPAALMRCSVDSYLDYWAVVSFVRSCLWPPGSAHLLLVLCCSRACAVPCCVASRLAPPPPSGHAALLNDAFDTLAAAAAAAAGRRRHRRSAAAAVAAAAAVQPLDIKASNTAHFRPAPEWKRRCNGETCAEKAAKKEATPNSNNA
jgi:hypothetical protein